MNDIEILRAAVSLAHNADWGRVIAAWKTRRAVLVESLVHGESLTEYRRAVLAGRIQQVDELLDLAATTPEDVQRFQSQ